MRKIAEGTQRRRHRAVKMSERVNEVRGGPVISMYHRFVELMLIVGLDENTGLVPITRDASSDEGSGFLNNIFYDEYEAQVLAAISSSKALIFQPTLQEDPTYPPSGESVLGAEASFMRSLSAPKERNVHSRKGQCSAQRPMHVNVAVLKQRLERSESAPNAKANMELPLSKDAIEGITTFCFPDNAKVYRQKPDNTIHFLVLTDVKGSKTYATCLTFYRLYKVEKDDEGHLSCTTQHDDKLLSYSFANSREISCYMPRCCVLVSKFPYFYAMKESLSYVISHGEKDYEEMFQFLKDFTFSMTMTPVPPAGNVTVALRLYNMNITLFPSEWPDKPVVDIPLHLAFLTFPIGDLLKIFSAILCEERIVFVSFNYALLTIIMESFLYYILPFEWRFTYVPILSTSSLELLEAPGTFMMGCHSKHLDVVEQVEGLVVVDIDEGTVSVNPEATARLSRRPSLNNNGNSNLETSSTSVIPDIPVEPANIFRKICQRARFQMELADVQRPFYYDIEQEREFRMKKCLQFNSEIGFACLEMTVNLFRGVLSYLRIDMRRFNRQQFMDDLSDSDKPFYERVLNTEIFKWFLEDRLDEKLDYWSDYEMKTRPYAKRISGGRLSLAGFSHRQQMKPQQRQASVTTFSSLTRRDLKGFDLPPLNDAVTYTRNAIAALNSMIEECSDPNHRSSYMYLRGLFHAAEGSTLAALDDFLSLHAHNARLIPVDLVGKLLKLVPESEREELLRVKGINHLADLAHDLEQEESSTPRRGIIENISLPDSDLCLEDFVETISLLEMASDYDTIQRLFLMLTNPSRPTHVEKYTFEVLKLSYEENQAQCESIALPDGSLQSNEIILRVSNLIKTDMGMGRIALTDKRLFFIKDVSNTYTEIVKLRNITRLDKVQLHSFLVAVDALVIEDSEKKVKFTATLKEERNLWALIINEMRAGKVVAEATKDFTVINEAVQNVLLVDAIIRSGRDERTSHHDRVSYAAESLCYYSLYMSEGRHNLPQDTIRALQHRVNPNMGQRDRKTVEVMLYTAGTEMLDNSSQAISPRLWCGMGDGKIRVFDASNWTLEDTFVQSRHTVATLVAVGESQVWAGSHGIFIIDTETITCNKTLTDHPDLVVAIVVTAQGRYAYSASVEGTIIQWEVQTLRKIRRLTLKGTCSLKSIKLYDDKLWCGTWHHITALDIEGNLLQTFTYTNPSQNGLLEIDCFGIFHDEIWAGCRREGRLIIWDERSTQLKTELRLECRGISVILLIDNKVWVGTKDGTIYIYLVDTKEVWKTIKAHDDAIRSLCAAESRYIMSGAGSMDGKVAIWNPNFDDTEAFNSMKDA